jgi:hypothetical protein
MIPDLGGTYDVTDGAAEWPSLLIEHAEQHYIQSGSATGRPVEVEHRDGGPDRHFHATTTDRATAQGAS